MADFTIRSDNVDVEQIMRQIRMRIKQKRGVDYTEEEIRELANVKLEKFLNPRAVRSELVEHYRRQRPPAPLPPSAPPEGFEFEAETIYQSHRMPLLHRLRRLLNPVLKLFFNPNPLIQALHRQAKMNGYVLERFDQVSDRFVTRDELDALNFEVLNNIVLEVTRLSIEVKNLSMRIESMNARQDFNERRARAFEGLVKSEPQGAPGEAAQKAPAGPGGEAEEPEARSRRRRRRRRRRPDGETSSQAAPHAAGADTFEGDDAGGDDATASAPGSGEGASEPDTDQ